MAKDTFNLHEWVGNKERRLLKEGMSAREYDDAKEAERLEKHPEKDKIKAVQAKIAKEKELLKKSTPVSQVIDEEFSEFKTYDDIIGGLSIRAGAMKKYLNKNQPELEYLADDLETTIEILNKEIYK